MKHLKFYEEYDYENDDHDDHDCAGNDWCTPEYLEDMKKKDEIEKKFGNSIELKINELLTKRYLKKITVDNWGKDFLDDIIFSEYYTEVKTNVWLAFKWWDNSSILLNMTEENFDNKINEIIEIINKNFDDVVLNEIKNYLEESGYYDFNQ